MGAAVPEQLLTVREKLTVRAILREAREARGWTQANLAERAKVSRSWVAAVESGWLNTPSLRYLLRVADALEVDRASLLPAVAADDPERVSGHDQTDGLSLSEVLALWSDFVALWEQESQGGDRDTAWTEFLTAAFEGRQS